MSAQPDFPPVPPLRGTAPREVLAALPPEDRDRFQSDFAAAVRAAATSLDLTQVHAVVEQWRRYAATVPARDRVVEIARQVLDGEPVDAVPADQVL